MAAVTSWGEKLLKRPLVEIRRGFCLDFEAPTEKSAVIALSVPSGKFVDIRVPKEPALDSTAVSVMPSAFELGPNVYANAGTLTTVVPTSEGAFACPEASACLAHSTWAHHIDSSGNPDTDGADMLLLANGEVLEVGVIDLGTGRGPRMFKELWINENVDGLPYIVVEIMDSTGSTIGNSDIQGRVVRIGPHCQAVLQTEDRFWLDRWRLVGAWKRDPCSKSGRRVGTASLSAEDEATLQTGLALPCLWACEDKVRQLGETILVDGRTWTVTEIGP
ncbi:hypothetical protein CMQ_5092 [Grosmannia clavigera kw1407]|uniref:Uncharacterized protein n=1 Tax=Grosmannia clavigera (strain kw1407 / UAMH 11150) TaxID=655863 RepID=F0XB38_GROCL|nr:uncharacterized protein CMQ_5092 [Grosmannia clavigera kw1407]EFX04830.1 hypothetical protein CMQ_5092 [Grosmannia clavigera kw1407]